MLLAQQMFTSIHNQTFRCQAATACTVSSAVCALCSTVHTQMKQQAIIATVAPHVAGKAYAAWRGHDQDALAAYDTLIGAFPTDFRGYLAKGMFLKERGRQGDAERMFLQAKFYAPDNMQAFVANRAGQQPDTEPLPDNGME